jgi:hypothetical protein
MFLYLFQKSTKMCFSAAASFTAGAVITSVGVATSLKVQKPSQRLFASIPLIFGIQQIAEGFVWISFQKPDFPVLQQISTFLFLCTALIIWPVMFPASLLLMEENSRKRKILRILLTMGIALALYYACGLVFFKFTPQIVNCHIMYEGDFPMALVMPALLVYIVVALTPLFVSSVKGMRWIGICMFLACTVAFIFYVNNFSSVWCFFAAIISLMIYYVLHLSAEKSRLVLSLSSEDQKNSAN